MENVDLENLRKYITMYRDQTNFRLYNGYVSLDISNTYNKIKEIVLRNPDNRQIILESIVVDGSFLKYASERLRRDRTIVTLAMSNNLDAAQYVDDVDLLEQVKKDINFDAYSKQR